jgi:hypothetical protein
MTRWTIALTALALAACGGRVETDSGVDAHADDVAQGDTNSGSETGPGDGAADDAAADDAASGGDGGGGTMDGGTGSDGGGTAPDGASCPGSLSVAIAAPTAGQMLETCTQRGMAVYFDFAATASGTGVSDVTFNWRNPDGALVAPPFVIDAPTAGRYVARRQIGGVAAPGDPPPLPIAGGRNAIGGTWQVIATATDACGRTATAMQSFSLKLTARNCPNP